MNLLPKYPMILCLLSLPMFANDDLLPPLPPWQGKSLELMVAGDHPWVTHFEQSDGKASPDYEQTMAWLEKLVTASPELTMETIGYSARGRAIRMVVASKERAFTPQALAASQRPLFLFHAGIHSGEIDGKDAGMMLLRDMTVRGHESALLDVANLLFIPILSVDGHEIASRFSRINQRGPEISGWRTNGRNLNLNRDYSKLETPELQALVRMINEWQPDLYYDIHVTDGMDYQYDITYGYNRAHGYSPEIATWLEKQLQPRLDEGLRAMGHIPGPLIFGVDRTDPKKGLSEWTAIPRFSNGYGDIRHLPTILVENHSLKPYRQRVLGTYVLLKETIKALSEIGDAMIQATQNDRKRRPAEVTLSWKHGEQPRVMHDMLGIAHRREQSDITGSEVIRWLGTPENYPTPIFSMNIPDIRVARPKAYWIPADWTEVIEKLALHGVVMERQSQAKEVEVEIYRLEDVKLEEKAFEGRVRATTKVRAGVEKMSYPKGSVHISTDQPLCELIVHLLEPQAPDSFFQWGYFHEILQRTEYFEFYAMEPMARKMMREDPALAEAFKKALAEDEKLAADPRARLNWFYSRSPWYDRRWLRYPVGRER